MRVSSSCQAVVLALLVGAGGAEAFSSPATPNDNAMRMRDVRQTVHDLTADNFATSLSTIEPFLLNEAGSTMYGKSMRRIAVRAKALGVEVPEGYAKEAKATAKKRAKQDEFIQAKIEEAASASATEEEDAESSAEEAAADETAAEGEAETVEEPELVEA